MQTKVIVCPNCGAKNRVPVEIGDQLAKCGRCHQLLPSDHPDVQDRSVLTLRCAECHAKNRVPVARLHAGPKCGRCSMPLQHENVMSGRTVMINDANFSQTVIQSPLPVLLYAWAPWCSVCSGINSMVDQLALETKGKLRIGKLNIEANPQLAARFNILSVPSFFIFDAGRLKLHLPGAVPKHELMMKMASYL